MVARAAIALLLAALVWAQSAWAGDGPSCAQYREPMAYNACLARHGPKANNVGTLRGGTQPGRAAQAYNRAPAARFYRWQRPQRAHGRMHMEFPVR
jgi:hypothetical protein